MTIWSPVESSAKGSWSTRRWYQTNVRMSIINLRLLFQPAPLSPPDRPPSPPSQSLVHSVVGGYREQRQQHRRQADADRRPQREVEGPPDERAGQRRAQGVAD